MGLLLNPSIEQLDCGIHSLQIILIKRPHSISTDCGLAAASQWHSRRSRGRSHAFPSSSSPSVAAALNGGHRLSGNPQVPLSKPNEKLRINNLLDSTSERRTSHNRSSSNRSSSQRASRRERGRRKARIIMGRETEAGEFPWQASLQLLHPVLGFIGHWCGGVLIHQSWILSAAHCVHK